MARPASTLLLLSLFLSTFAAARAQAPSRLAGDWRASGVTTLAYAKPPAAAARASQAQPSLALPRMILLLEPSPAQSQALTQKLENLRDSSSGQYHQWLTPASFADSYSNSASDVAAVSSWLLSQGFTVAPPPASRAWIEFSGTVTQVEQAFAVHALLVHTPSGARVALDAPISVPSALAPLVHGLVSLDGSLAAPALTAPQPAGATAADLAANSSAAQAAAITPKLLAAQLHLDTLAAAGSLGAGQTVAIAARAPAATNDVAAFRDAFDLPASALQIIGDKTIPGDPLDAAGATLAASWAGAAAPRATIAVAPAASTAATDGLDLSLAALVDQAPANTVVVGYSLCEAAVSEPHRAFFAALYRQAAAQGMAIVSAAGDSGAAACHAAGSADPVSSGLAVNALASTPWNTAVGVISASGSGLTAWAPASAGDPSYAGGGGSSSAFAVPFWQSNQSDSSARSLPDLALPTALDSSLNRGLVFCLGTASGQPCQTMRAGGSAAAAAVFAGVAALVAEKYGAQGNLAPNLYALQRVSTAFQDVDQGSAQLPCLPSSPACSSSGHIGFAAQTGFDQATGLGSLDAQMLLADWNKPIALATGTVAVEITNAGQTLNPSNNLTLYIVVTPNSPSPALTGNLQIVDNAGAANASVLATGVGFTTTYGNGAAQAVVTVHGFVVGANQLQAIYGNDPNYAGATSPQVDINGQPGTTALYLTPSNYSPFAGSPITVLATVTDTANAGAAMPTGTVTATLGNVTSPATNIDQVSGKATLPMTMPAAGQMNLQGAFTPGDINYYGSNAAPVAINILKNPAPTLDLPANLTGMPGQQVTLPVTLVTTATAATTSAIYPSGALSVSVDGNQQSSQQIAAGSASSNYNFAVTLPNTNGNHSVTVNYGGDNYYTNGAASVTANVAKATPTVTVAWPNNPTAGNPITVSATVTGPAGATAAPSGSLTLSVDGTAQAPANLTATGATTATTTLSVGPLVAGTHSLAATYNGDGNYAVTQTAAAVTAQLALGPTKTTLTASSLTNGPGVTETLTATIAPQTIVNGVTYTFSGTVSFYDGAKALGSVAVNGNTAVLAGIALATNVSHSITAVYSGDATWASSASTAITIASSILPVNVVLTANVSTAYPGEAVVLTATVTPLTPPLPGAEQNPTGNVVFYMGSTILGQAALVPIALTDSSTATLILQTLPGGTDTIYAIYLGDGSYATGTSNYLTLTIQDYTLTPAPGNPPENLTIVKGGAGSESFIVNGLGGFTGELQILCTPPAQDDMTCTASPQQVYPGATVTFTVQTYLTGTEPPAITSKNSSPGWPPALGGTALAGLICFLLPFGRRARIFAGQHSRRWMSLILLLIVLASAGLGCNSVSTISTGQGTPLGVAIVKVTATVYVDNTVVSRSTYFTVNVVNP